MREQVGHTQRPPHEATWWAGRGSWLHINAACSMSSARRGCQAAVTRGCRTAVTRGCQAAVTRGCRAAVTFVCPRAPRASFFLITQQQQLGPSTCAAFWPGETTLWTDVFVVDATIATDVFFSFFTLVFFIFYLFFFIILLFIFCLQYNNRFCLNRWRTDTDALPPSHTHFFWHPLLTLSLARRDSSL